MTTAETKSLLLYLGGDWPDREISDETIRFWSKQLRDVAYDDAEAAVDAYVADGNSRYPRASEILSRCPRPWPNGRLYARYGELRAKLQGEKDGKHGYRRDGQLTANEAREYAELSRKLGVRA
jgi:hypothetical protein